MNWSLSNILAYLMLAIVLLALRNLFVPKGSGKHRAYNFIIGGMVAMGIFFILVAVLPRGDFYGRVWNELPPGSGKKVALTYDDGPYPPYTEELLAVLATEKVPATFFLVGANAQAHPQIVKKIIQQGHEIGVHTLNHIDLLKLDEAQQREQIVQGKNILEQLSGRKVGLFRPPHGFRDFQVMNLLQQADLKIVNWSVLSKDWLNPPPEVIATRTLQHVQPGAIVLLHDGDSPYNKLPRANTVEATKIIIRELKAQGYTFVTLKELAEQQKG